MSRKLATLGCLLAVLPCLQAFVLFQAGNGQPYHWQLDTPHAGVSTNVVNPVTHAVRYFVASDAYSTTNTAAEINAIHACFDVWEAVPGSAIQFEFGGFVAPGVDVNTSDGTNVVYWAKNSLFVANGTAYLGGSLAFAFPQPVSGQSVLREGDIVLNGVEFDWFTDRHDTSNLNGFFIEGPLLHEIGHILGLQHSPVAGATMFARSRRWLKTLQPGLSPDDIAAARFLYPDAATLPPNGTLSGRVTKSGANVFGAAVIVEDLNGNAVAGVMSASDGTYEIVQLAPSGYTVRAAPVDPGNGSPSLVKGSDIASAFFSADTQFVATEPMPATVSAGLVTTVDLAVEPGAVGVHVGYTRGAGESTDHAAPMALPRGISNTSMGLVIPQDSASLNANAVLLATGSGVTFGPATVTPYLSTSHALLTAQVTVAANAVPGLRSFIIRQPGAAPGDVYANGALEIMPPVIDENFDGLDDDFQRKWFPLWTAPEAGPNADPDEDQSPNADEAFAGTIPTDSGSRLAVQSVLQDMSGTTVTWQSVPGRRYQAYGRERFGIDSWVEVGGPVIAAGSTASVMDAGATGPMKFYRVEVLADLTE